MPDPDSCLQAIELSAYTVAALKLATTTPVGSPLRRRLAGIIPRRLPPELCKRLPWLCHTS